MSSIQSFVDSEVVRAAEWRDIAAVTRQLAE
jgi:hypothetical protein